MLEKVFAPVLRFFGIIASSLTGITAVMTAVGFLAERAHLAMLGFTTIPADLNQYLYTGARFFALLPMLIINSIGLTTLDLARKYLLYFAAILLALLIFKLLLRIAVLNKLWRKLLEKIGQLVANHRNVFLFFLILLQFTGIYFYLAAIPISNLLFLESSPDVNVQSFSFLQTNAQVLTTWITAPNETALFQHLGRLVLITLFLGVILWQLVATFRKDQKVKPRLWQNIWIGVNLVLFGTQLILLPINYGIVLLPNKFPVVTVTFEDEVAVPFQAIQNERLALLHEKGGSFYLYSRETAQVWLVRQNQLHSLVYLGMADIFKSPGKFGKNP